MLLGSIALPLLAHHAGTLVVERPAGDQELHAHGVVAGTQRMFQVQLVGGLHLVAVDLDAETGRVGDGDLAADDLRRLLGQPLQALLPDPVGVQGVVLPRCRRTAVRHHRQRDVEEGTRGLRCVGVALRYNNPVMDAISCSVPIERMTAERLEQIASALTRTARQLEDSAPVQGTL